MRFKEALFDGSDPSYAPCLSFNRGHAFWKARAKYVEAGFRPQSINLEMPGERGDEHALERAKLCRQYTREMVRWWDAQEASRADLGTWGYVIDRYRTDKFSPYADVKQNTRDGYDYTCDRWKAVIGHMKIESLTFERMKAIEGAMRGKGYTDSNVRRMFTMLRGLASYGSRISETKAKCRDVKDTLSEMRFRMAPARSIAPTRDQVEAIVAAADAAGDHLIATGWLIQFEFILRAVDVRGQWLRSEGGGGIVRNGRRWQDGLTWEMFDADLTHFEKVISKTEKSMPEPYRFDLTSIPYLRDRIARARPQSAVGPVFVSREGLPYDQTTWARVWAKYRKAAGVSKEVKVTDLRAGGATEARAVGADQWNLRDAAQHSNVSTTSRYVRARSEAAGKVVQLRQKGRL